jgi:SAM-dependent methyltransferase
MSTNLQKRTPLPPTATERAEFDEHAEGYDAGMRHPLKRLLGRSADEYLDWKARWLMEDLASRTLPVGQTLRSTLDLGCGVGALLQRLCARGLAGRLVGCDTSPAMLAEARRRWTCGRAVEWTLSRPTRLPFADSRFSIIIASSLVHHVPPDRRPALFSECRRVLAPRGRIYVFEHNPWNPITRLVVRTTRIDAHARLAPPGQVVDLLKHAGFAAICVHYLMFYPVRFQWAYPLESCLRRLPFGGQYVVSAGLGEEPQPPEEAPTSAAVLAASDSLPM